MKKFFCFLNLLFVSLLVVAGGVKSPNGNVELKFSVDGKGRPVYEMTYKGREVVKPSHLGLVLAKDKHASKGMKETDLMDGFTIAKEETSTFDETWQPVWGETKDIRNHYVEYVAVLQHRLPLRVPAAEGTQLLPYPGRDVGVCDGGRPYGLVASWRL